MDNKKDILWRIYLIYFLMFLFGVFIISKIVIIQFSEGDMWRAKAESFSTRLFDIEANRGNIYDINGNLIATSLPYFEVAMDVNADAITKDFFNKHIDSLAYCLSDLFKDRSKKEYIKLLRKARKEKSRWVVLQKNVSYPDLQKMKKFPILRRGKNRGGFVYLQTNKREKPFQSLAARTIGKINDNGTGKSYGLEVAYNDYLKGIEGHRVMQRIAGGIWRPIETDEEIEPEDGNDVLSTIDINVQDVAENSLRNTLKKHGASHGCLVMMEVETGAVTAIVNLTRRDTSTYLENLNYAVGRATVPGSTFKLASLIALMEDHDLSLDEQVEVGNGTTFFSDAKVSDSHPPIKTKYTVQEVFEQSSNVGVTKLIWRYYSKNPQQYIDRLYAMNLNTPLKIALPGEAEPYIKNTKDKTWSKISLPWISYGYETRITPLQILTFYSAIANNGKMMRPMFVKEIRKRGQVVKTFQPEVINAKVCSEESVKKAKKMMEGVVLNGTAKSLKASEYQIAGKTGTAQMGIVNGRMTYQASFVGYFPAEHPKYCCIVVVSAPSGDAYYGGAVAGPVFKDVADKVYASSSEIHPAVNADSNVYVKRNPTIKSGKQKDLITCLHKLKVNYQAQADIEDEWASTLQKDSITVELTGKNLENTLKNKVVPNLMGLNARDAFYLLENNGLRVKIVGSGSVVKQSLEPGSKFSKGNQIVLELI
jgi:cell division protein FtsI (penicillin-binding protein 3)